MKILNSVLALTLAIPAFAFADMPADAPGKLANPVIWTRCFPGGPAIDPAECSEGNKLALQAGCVSELEFNYANSHSLILLCRNTTLISACVCGCFDASTRVLGINAKEMPQWLNVSEVKRGSKILSISENATLSNLSLKGTTASFSSNGPEIAPIYIFETSFGKLSVTQNHAMLLADGRLVAAKEVNLNDKLISTSANEVEIKSIERRVTELPVYNFQIGDVKSAKEHLVVAEGLVVGDLYLQNRISHSKNSIIGRK